VLPGTEQCDGLDHDCDGTPNNPAGGCTCTSGRTQSCYTGPQGTAGQGTCKAGTQTCTGGVWGACTGEVAPVAGDCAHASCTGGANPGCTCVDGATQACYGGPQGTAGKGTCHGGNQTCAAGQWGTCAGEVTPAAADACVAPGASYSASADLDCSGTLTRHDPVATPTVTGATAAPLTPTPSGYVTAAVAQPLDTVTLHGAATDVDGTTTFSYRWRLLAAPLNNTAGLSGAPGATTADYSTEQNPTLFTQLAGDYSIGVTARDASGCDSAEVKVLVRVKPHSSVHVQLTWDEPVDVDLQLVQGATTAIFDTNACYFNQRNPNWGAISPSLDIDDVAGCNPENINYGSIGGTTPTIGSTYAVYVHYFCDRRGHRPDTTNPSIVCYEPDVITTQPTATVKIYVDGTLAKIDGTSQDAVFTEILYTFDAWKPLTLRYDSPGVWRVIPSYDPIDTKQDTTCDSAASTTCVCSQLANPADPYCGTSGAACRQAYP
jgi:hypothetical protein